MFIRTIIEQNKTSIFKQAHAEVCVNEHVLEDVRSVDVDQFGLATLQQQAGQSN